MPPPNALSRLRLRHLQLIQVLSQTGSLRAASEVLFQTQSTLSKSLQEAERLFGTHLFDRKGGRLTPTLAGRIAIRGASLILAEVANLQSEVEQLEGAVETRLRLGVVPFLGLNYAPSIAAYIQRHFPTVTIVLKEASVVQLHEDLLAGSLDAALVTYMGAISGVAIADSVVIEGQFTENFSVIGPCDCFSAGRTEPYHWADLAEYPWILPSPANHVRRILEEAFIACGRDPPKPHIESSNVATNVKLVEKGLGITAIPASFIATMGLPRAVSIVSLSKPLSALRVCLAYRKVSKGQLGLDALSAALRNENLFGA